MSGIEVTRVRGDEVLHVQLADIERTEVIVEIEVEGAGLVRYDDGQVALRLLAVIRRDSSTTGCA